MRTKRKPSNYKNEISRKYLSQSFSPRSVFHFSPPLNQFACKCQMGVLPEHNSKQDLTSRTIAFFKDLGLFKPNHEVSERQESYSDIIRNLLKVDRIDRGRIVCTIKFNDAYINRYNTLHGGVVASVAEVVGIACAKTVAGEKEIFLGEFSTAYLAAARLYTELEVEGSVLRQGRSVIVTNIEFRIKESKKLAYTSRATYYIMPVARL